MRYSPVLAAVLVLGCLPRLVSGAGVVETPLKDLGSVPPRSALAASLESILVCSPDGTRLARVASEPRTRKWRVVCDGKQGPPVDDVANPSLAFTPDGKRLIYAARTGPDRVVMVDDKVIRNALSYAISPDGKRMAYVLDAGNSNYALMMNDTKLTTRSHEISCLTFSPDSRRFAYIIQTEEIARGYIWLRDMITVDGKGGRVAYADMRAVTFSPDSRHWAAAAQEKGGKDKDRWRVVMDDKELPVCDEVGDPVFAPAGLHLAYPARSATGWFMIRDSRSGPKFDRVGLPTFSPDATHLVYSAQRGASTVVVCDDRTTGDYSAVDWITFSPDGKHIAWSASRGDDSVVVCDGVEGPPHSEVVIPRQATDLPGKLRYVAVDKVTGKEERKAVLVEVDWPADRTWEDAFKAEKK